jgi:diketogulonate reductase-like aldo/keto reductase
MSALDGVRAKGMTRHVGVSNFPSALVEEAARLSPSPLVTDQVEYHPYLSQEKLLGLLRAKGMSLTAYCPLARGRVADDPVLTRIAAGHGKTPGQAALRWLVQQEGVIAIPKTLSEARAAENLAIFDFALTPAEMSAVSALARPGGRLIDPDWGPDWD